VLGAAGGLCRMTPWRRSSWRIRWRPTRAALPPRGHDPGGDVGSLAAGAAHGVPVGVGIRLDQAVEPHDHVQQDVADHADPQPRRRAGLGLPRLTEAARVHLWPWPGRWLGRGRAR
jgi:hypothetical protein